MKGGLIMIFINKERQLLSANEKLSKVLTIIQIVYYLILIATALIGFSIHS